MPSSAAPSACRIRTLAPVASSALSKPISCLFERVTNRSSASSFITVVRVSTSTFCSSYHSSGRKRISSRDSTLRTYVFVSGGRLYGGSSSRPTISTSPSAPSSRRWRAQLAAARPPPMIRYLTVRSGKKGVDLGRDFLALVLLEEVGRALDHGQADRTGNEIDEALTRLRGEDRVRVREAHERRLLPGRKAVAGRIHLGHAGGVVADRHQQREGGGAGLRLGVRPRRLVRPDHVLGHFRRGGAAD